MSDAGFRRTGFSDDLSRSQAPGERLPIVWPARRSLGGDASVWVAGGLLLAALGALVLGGSREPGSSMLLMCGLAAVLGLFGGALLVWALAYRGLRYSLTARGLHIDWLGGTLIVPYAAVQGIYTGQRLAGHATPDVFSWPGISVGPARVRGLGPLRFYATSTDQSELTFITVQNGGVIVSAREPHEFRAALIGRVEQSQGDDQAPAAGWERVPPFRAPWTAVVDAWLPLCATIGLLVLLAIVAVITSRFDSLPNQLPLRFDAGGLPNLITSKTDLLRLPLFGLALLLVDLGLGIWLHPGDRLLARLLWLGGAVLQVVLLVGVVRLVA